MSLTWEDPGKPPVRWLGTGIQPWTAGDHVKFSLRKIDDGHHRATMSCGGGTAATIVETILGTGVRTPNVWMGIGMGDSDGVLMRTRDGNWRPHEPEKDSVLRVTITPRGE